MGKGKHKLPEEEKFRRVSFRKKLKRWWSNVLRVAWPETPVICSTISQYAQKLYHFFAEDGLVLTVIFRYALLAQFGVYVNFVFFISWRPWWGQLEDVWVPTGRGWVGEVFPHMTRDGASHQSCCKALNHPHMISVSYQVRGVGFHCILNVGPHSGTIQTTADLE